MPVLYELFMAFCHVRYQGRSYPQSVDSFREQASEGVVANHTDRHLEVEKSISHFIPSIRLEGSREDKLRKLDFLIAHYLDLRKRLAGDSTSPQRRPGMHRWHAGPSRWQWFGAGAVIGVTSALLILARFL